jgi:hypothetical protein
VLVAGLQIGNLGRLLSVWPALVAATLAFAAAMMIVGHFILKASRVLVVNRATVSDLLRQQNRQIMERRGDQPPTPADPEIEFVLDTITGERAWLLAGEESFAELFVQCERARLAGDDPDRLRGRLEAVTVFARATLTRTAYERLVATIIGWPGRAFILAVVVFAVALGWPVPSRPAVTAAYRLDVLLTGDQAALRRAGLSAECRTGTRLTGVALGGSLRAPEVVTEPRTATVAAQLSTCEAARFTVTREVGLPIPYVK